MVPHQSRPPLGELQATVMNARPGGAKGASDAAFEEAFLHDRELPRMMGDARQAPEVPRMLSTEAPVSMARTPRGWNNSRHMEKDRAGKTIHLAQVESVAPATCSGGMSDSYVKGLSLPQSDSRNLVRHDTPPGDLDEDQRVARTVGCATAPTKAAERKEAASAQAVKRGHTVTMIEVPDEEDNTAYQQWLAKGSPLTSPTQCKAVLLTLPESLMIPTKTPHWDSRCTDIIAPPGPLTSPPPDKGAGPTHVTKNEMTSPTVATPSAAGVKVQEVPHQWMRPFEVDWTLRAICKARNDNATCAALAVWIHKDKGTDMTDELLKELRLGGENTRERLYELHEPPRIIHRHESTKSDFLILITLHPVTGTKTLTMKELLDSGCTSSAINRSFVNEHQLETRKVAVPIPVYNADGTRNTDGNITDFIEL